MNSDIIQANVEEAKAHLKRRISRMRRYNGRNLDQQAIKILNNLWNIIYKQHQWSLSSSTNHKKSATTKCSNNYTISLIKHPSKIQLRIIKLRLESNLGGQDRTYRMGILSNVWKDRYITKTTTFNHGPSPSFGMGMKLGQSKQQTKKFKMEAHVTNSMDST